VTATGPGRRAVRDGPARPTSSVIGCPDQLSVAVRRRASTSAPPTRADATGRGEREVLAADGGLTGVDATDGHLGHLRGLEDAAQGGVGGLGRQGRVEVGLRVAVVGARAVVVDAVDDDGGLTGQDVLGDLGGHLDVTAGVADVVADAEAVDREAGVPEVSPSVVSETMMPP
jgi:hypothetical protein